MFNNLKSYQGKKITCKNIFSYNGQEKPSDKHYV